MRTYPEYVALQCGKSRTRAGGFPRGKACSRGEEKIEKPIFSKERETGV